MVVHVDQARNQELASEIDRLRARRDFNRFSTADGGDMTGTSHD
jgi:hypothetical protein